MKSQDSVFWTEDLDREFELAKATIVQKIHKGVTMFQVNRDTALVTDWSKEGHSLGLWQNIAIVRVRSLSFVVKEDGRLSSCPLDLIMILRVGIAQLRGSA